MMRYLFALALGMVVLGCQNNTYQIGERLYKGNCASCHMDKGEGLAGLIPPLAGSDYLGRHLDQLPCIIRKGLQDTIVVNGKIYVEMMPANPALSEIQITNLLNYIGSSWGNQHPPYQLEQVRELLKTCE